MITIRFSQCTRLDLDHWANTAKELPIEERCRYYENSLMRFPHDEFSTYDEHLVLIGQYLHRKGLATVMLVSICGCGGYEKVLPIALDDDGDMLEDPHHGFFPQRLKYLR